MGPTKSVLCSAAPEKAVAQLENAFDGAGVSPGLLLPRIFALAAETVSADTRRLIVQQEASVLSMAVVADGGIRLIRTKPLPQSGGSWTGAEREISLAMSYIRATMEIVGPIEVVVSASDDASAQSIAESFGGQADVSVRISAALQVCPDAHLAATLGNGRLAPMAAVLDGGAP